MISSVSMAFEDGAKLSAWLQFSIRDTYTDPLGEMTFIAAPPRARISEYRQRLEKGSTVNIFVNDISQGDFLITTSERVIDKEQGTVFYLTCKSPLVTTYEGSVTPALSFSSQTDAPLGEIILKALLPYEFDKLTADAIANVSALTGRKLSGTGGKVNLDRLKWSEAQAQNGESAYAFCARLLSRRGVALRMAADGTLLLTAPNYDQQVAYTVVQDFDGQQNGDRFFGPIKVTSTNDGQFSECRVRGLSPDRRGKTRGAHPSAIVTSSELGFRRPPYVATGRAQYKRLEIQDNQARDVVQCRNVAIAALGSRARNAFTVTGKVNGFVSATGRIWQVDTIARVIVEAEDLDEEMWVLERVFEQDVAGGQSTRLTLIPKGALVLGEDPS